MTASFIIPVFNEEKCLPLLLTSIEKQTCQVDEIIVCDNQSSDQSVKIARSYQHRLPIVILTQEEKGIKPTLEKAWRAAKGDVLLRVDADTILPPNWVANVLRHFRNDLDLTGLNGPTLAADGNVFQRIYYFLGGCIGSYFLQLIRGYPLLLGCNCAFKKSALDVVDGYRTDIECIDDQLITNKLIKAGYKLKWFQNCFAYHSTRRYWGNPKEYLYNMGAIIHPRFYHEKK